VGAKESKHRRFEQDADAFLALKIKDKKSFAMRFSAGLAKARMLFDVEPCLTHDFQVLVDRSGRLFRTT